MSGGAGAAAWLVLSLGGRALALGCFGVQWGWQAVLNSPPACCAARVAGSVEVAMPSRRWAWASPVRRWTCQASNRFKLDQKHREAPDIARDVRFAPCDRDGAERWATDCAESSAADCASGSSTATVEPQ